MLAFLCIVMVEIWELLVCVLTILAAFDIDCRLDSFQVHYRFTTPQKNNQPNTWTKRKYLINIWHQQVYMPFYNRHKYELNYVTQTNQYRGRTNHHT